MAAAVVRASVSHGAGPTLTTAETGVKFNRSDDDLTTAPVPIPTATGTNFSWIKPLSLEVTTLGTTAMTNRNIYLGGAPTTGLALYFMDQPTYRQPGSGNLTAASGSNGATPAGYTALTTSPQLWDNTSVSTGSTGRKGDTVEVVLGVSFNYAGGAGTAIALPNILLQYDEA